MARLSFFIFFIFSCSMEKQAKLPVLYDISLPIVSIEIEKKNAVALLDTGAYGVVLSSEFYSMGKTGNVNLSTLCFAEICFYNVAAKIISSELMIKNNIQAIVGMSILKKLSLKFSELNFVELSRTSIISCSGDRISFDLDQDKRPYVSVKISDKVYSEFLIDTGAVFTLFSADLAGKIKTLQKESKKVMGCSIQGCKKEYFLGKVTKFCLGKSCVDNLEVKFPVWNVVGNSFFSRFEWIIDFPKKEIIICKG